MKIAILGTGAMGSAMGEAILNAGHELIVYNRTDEKTKLLEEKGAQAVTHAYEAINQADVSIFVMINGLAVKNTLLNDNTLAFVKNKYIINAAISSVQDIYELSKAVSEHGGKFAEVSMQAVPDDLRAATGTLNLGCNKEDEQFLLDILSTFSGNIKVIGEIGDSAKLDSVSLVGYMMSLTKIAYSVALAQKLGIKPEVYEPMINMMAPIEMYKFTSNMVARNYNEVIGSVEGAISLMGTVLNLAESQGLPTELIVEMKKLFEKTAEIGYSQKDGSAVIEVLLNNN